VARPLSLSGALTLQDPQGNEHRLVGSGAALILELRSLRALRELARVAPGRAANARVLATLRRGLEEADVTLYVRLRGRTAARLSPGTRAGLIGRLLGLPGLRLTPILFLARRAPRGGG